MGLRRIFADDLPRPIAGCHAVVADDLVVVGGLLATDYKTGIVPEAKGPSSLPSLNDSFAAQSKYVLRAANTILDRAGCTFADVVRIDQFITERRVAAPYLRVRRAAFPLEKRPASTLITVPGLPVPLAAVSAEIIALAPGVTKKGIFTDRVPVNFPGVPHGVQAGDLVFVQGQIASDFRTPLAKEAQASPFWYETSMERQTKYVIDNLAKILEAADSSLDDVVKAHVYLTDLDNFQEFEAVWASRFRSNAPARTIIPVSSLGSPECKVEINAIATRRNVSKRYIKAATAMQRDPLTESHAVRVGNWVFLSGLIAGNFETGIAGEAQVPAEAPFFASEVERQLEFIVKQAALILAHSGSSLKHLVSAQAYLPRMTDYYAFASAWRNALGSELPCLTSVQIPNAGLCPESRIMLDLVGYCTSQSV